MKIRLSALSRRPLFLLKISTHFPLRMRAKYFQYFLRAHISFRGSRYAFPHFASARLAISVTAASRPSPS
jgi:hypothetical protein